MTETEYLTSTSPSDMHALLVERGLATEERCRRFVEACLSVCTCPDSKATASFRSGLEWQRIAESWAIGPEKSGCPCTKVVRADLLRCIFGNPWRLPVCLQCGDGRHWPAYNRMDCSACKGTGRGPYPINPDWITWRDGTVPKLARACVETVCQVCDGTGSRNDSGPDEWWPDRACAICRGAGRISSPTFDPLKLAVLADALEEAGCCDEGILGHLRQTEVGDGGACGGQGLESITRPVTHVRGCWVVELFLAKATEKV